MEGGDTLPSADVRAILGLSRELILPDYPHVHRAAHLISHHIHLSANVTEILKKTCPRSEKIYC